MTDTCPCFPGTCRGGEVINGKTALGQVCKAEIPADKQCTLCGQAGHRAHACPWRTMVCMGCGRDVVTQPSGFCPPCGQHAPLLSRLF